MTSDELIGEVKRLVVSGSLREAVDFSVRHLPEVRSQMTAEHVFRLHELMHIADVFDDVEPSTAARARAERPPQPAPRA